MTITVRSASVLLVVIAAACATGRLMSAQRFVDPSLLRDMDADPSVDRRPAWPAGKPKPMPTFSSNDRSRWATIRALVDDKTYVVGKRVLVSKDIDKRGYVDSGIVFEDGWKTIDLVLNPAPVSQEPETREFYSSKPPLLSSLIAGLYWLLQSVFGWTLRDQPALVVRTILFAINIVPFAISLLAIDRWAGKFARHEWTRLVVVAAAAFGTIVTPFLITLNNHVLGTFSVVFALDGLLKVWFGEARRPWLAYLQTGFFAAFAASNDLPALAFAALALGLLLLTCDAKRTLLFAVPPAAAVAIAFVGSNYLAVGRWEPAYSEFGKGSGWYDYQGSPWTPPAEGETKYGIDWAKLHESRSTYAFHVLIGHHGLFSMTPLWLLAMAGACMALRRPRDPSAEGVGLPVPRFLGPLTLTLTVVVVGFYLYKSDNYGGWTNGLRWLMWLTPLWLLSMIPALDVMATCPRRRAAVYVLLAVSVMSAHYALWNPWQHPWIYDLMQACGWKGYGR